MKQWYAVHCRPRQEARAEEHLNRQGFEVFHPRLRVLRQRRAGLQPVIESLFPRYLFILLDDVADNWAPIRSTRGVAGLVRSGHQPLSVPDAVIDEIKRRTSPETGYVDLTTATDFRAGEKLRITEGPFKGYEAVFQSRRGEERVMVLLQIMHQAQSITVPHSAVARY